MYITYGIGLLSKDKFKKPSCVDVENKISGGLWCCPMDNEIYSEWIAIALLNPIFIRGKTAIPYIIRLKDNAKVLKLTSENINLYTDSSNKYMDFDKVKSYDMLYFTKNLVENVKSFESYYIESVQVLNFNSIHYEEFCLDKEYIKSEKFKTKASQVLSHVNGLILKTDAAKALISAKRFQNLNK